MEKEIALTNSKKAIAVTKKLHVANNILTMQIVLAKQIFDIETGKLLVKNHKFKEKERNG